MNNDSNQIEPNPPTEPVQAPPNEVNAPITGNATPPPPPPTPSKSSLVKKIIIAVVVVFVLIFITGIIGGMWSSAKKDIKQAAELENSQEAVTDNSTSGLKKTTYTTYESNSDNRVTVTVEHPADWKVEQDPAEEKSEGFIEMGNARIISPKGNVLLLKDMSFGGRGGDCFDEVDITLIKKISTNSSKYIFVSFSDNIGDDEYFEKVTFQRVADPDSTNNFKDDIVIYNNLKDGEVFKGDCRAYAGYPSVISIDDSSVVDINVVDINGEEVTYDQIKDDVEFIAMLQSLVTSGEK